MKFRNIIVLISKPTTKNYCKSKIWNASQASTVQKNNKNKKALILKYENYERLNQNLNFPKISNPISEC